MYPFIKLTAKSDAVLKGQQKVELIATQTIDEPQQQEALPFEADLLNWLKSTRHSMAEKENVPAYIIVGDNTLVEIATYLPQSLDELRLISGFGDIKLARYGREFLEPVKMYCHQHGLPSRIDQKSKKRERKSPRKERSTETLRNSDTRLTSLNLYRSGKTINEVAQERGLSVNTIETHLSYFITTGEMDIFDMVNESKLPAIKDAIESYGSERLAPLKEILGEAYSYSEIKAVVAWTNRNN
jgi:ATP-dependent DNA helicase RecQ